MASLEKNTMIKDKYAIKWVKIYKWKHDEREMVMRLRNWKKRSI